MGDFLSFLGLLVGLLSLCVALCDGRKADSSSKDELSHKQDEE